MPFRWSLNPYKGCVHGCQYCYARRYHSFLDLNPGRDFSGVVFVKVNLPAVLRQELSRPSWRREQVAVGTATDPYQPIEGRYRLTRASLQAFVDHATPISLVTKGTLIVRDVDVLTELVEGPGCTVVFSLTTLDSELWQRLEPGTPPPRQRLAAMRRLADAGVRAGVLIAPVLPGLTDGQRSLERLVHAASDHNAQFVGARTLYLQPGVKEHFLGFLRGYYPQLLQEYERLYPGAYTPKRFQEEVRGSVTRVKEQIGLQDRPPAPNRALRQLDLAL